MYIVNPDQPIALLSAYGAADYSSGHVTDPSHHSATPGTRIHHGRTDTSNHSSQMSWYISCLCSFLAVFNDAFVAMLVWFICRSGSVQSWVPISRSTGRADVSDLAPYMTRYTRGRLKVMYVQFPLLASRSPILGLCYNVLVQTSLCELSTAAAQTSLLPWMAADSRHLHCYIVTRDE